MFGAKCFIKVPDEQRTKLDDKARECQLIGFEGESIYVIVDADKQQLWSQNVIFMEGCRKCTEGNTPLFPGFTMAESAHIEEVTDEVESMADVSDPELGDTKTR